MTTRDKVIEGDTRESFVSVQEAEDVELMELSGDLAFQGEHRETELLDLTADRASIRSFKKFDGEKGLSTFTGILAILSTIIGGGIVGVPYSYLNFGIPLAVVVNLIAVCCTIYTSYLYLKAKDALPDKPDSLYEIGYMSVGKASIYLVGGIQLINSFGCLILYFIVFGDTAAQFFGSFYGVSLGDAWYASKMVYVLILAGLLLPVVLKKDLAELEILSYILFCAVGLFILVNFIELEFDPNFTPAKVTSSFWKPVGGIALIEALNVTLVAYGY